MSLSLGRQIIFYRKRLGLSQKELASAVGLSPTTLNRYERGVREPNISQLLDIAKALNVTGDALLGLEHPDLTAKKSGKYTTFRAIQDLNNLGQERVLEFISALRELPKYFNPADSE